MQIRSLFDVLAYIFIIVVLSECMKDRAPKSGLPSKHSSIKHSIWVKQLVELNDKTVQMICLQFYIICIVSCLNFCVITESHGINASNYLTGTFKTQVKRIIVDTAKEWPTYFCRLFPVAVSIFFCKYLATCFIPTLLNFHWNGLQHVLEQFAGCSNSKKKSLKNVKNTHTKATVCLKTTNLG